MEIDLLTFNRPPESFDHCPAGAAYIRAEDIVPPRAFSVHLDGNFRLLQHRHEVGGCELGTLIRVEDIGLTIAGKGFLNRFDTEGRFQCDRQPRAMGM